MDIYSFDNYRKLIAELMHEKKKTSPSFSYRKFACEAQLKNPGYLHDVICGKRRISKRVTEEAIRIFSLNSTQAEFFKTLIRHDHAKNFQEKQKAYAELQKKRHYSHFFHLHKAQLRYYEQPIYALIIGSLESLECQPGNEEQIRSFLRQKFPLSEIREATKDLLEWKLIQITDQNLLKPTEAFLAPPPGLDLPVRLMNQKWLEDAVRALDEIQPEDRNISTTFLSVSDLTRELIERKVELFRKEIFALVEKDKNADTLLQLSIALFPRGEQS